MKKASKIKTAIVYAQALFDSVETAAKLKTLYNDVCKLANLSEKDFSELVKLDNPLLPLDIKFEALSAVSDKLGLNQNLCNTLKLLAEHRELNVLKLVIEQFILLYHKKYNIAEVDVLTAVSLTKQQDSRLKEALVAIFQKDILINYIHAPQIIGGLIIKYGTHYIDNSIRHKLDLLEQVMKGKK